MSYLNSSSNASSSWWNPTDHAAQSSSSYTSSSLDDRMDDALVSDANHLPGFLTRSRVSIGLSSSLSPAQKRVTDTGGETRWRRAGDGEHGWADVARSAWPAALERW